MTRVLPIAGWAAVCLGLTGCGQVWDTVSSRKFRDNPYTAVKAELSPADPIAVLRASPDGGERAKAMRRLKEPVRDGRSQAEQDEVMEVLNQAATADPSPLVRMSAVEALGRFQDPRAPGVLVTAFRRADGRPEGSTSPAPADPGVTQVGAAPKGMHRDLFDKLSLTGPSGFAPETAAAIRCRALEALGKTGSPDGIAFLSQVAGGKRPDAGVDGTSDREVRLAAVRGLGYVRHPDAVAALARVMTAETGKDTAVAGRAHDGLVKLTGRRMPADPVQWNDYLATGATVAPEPTIVDRATDKVAAWFGP